MIRFVSIVLFALGGIWFIAFSMLFGSIFLACGAIFGIWGTIIEAKSPRKYTGYRRQPGTLDDPRAFLPDGPRDTADKAGADPLAWLDEMPPRRHR